MSYNLSRLETPHRQLLIILIMLLIWLPLPELRAQAVSDASTMPRLQRVRNGSQFIVKGKPFLILGAEADNSSGSSLEFMDSSFARLQALHANTAVVSLSWELLEPVEGRYDFTLLDGLIAGARKRGLHLVFLWFGTYKNTFSSYAPAWVKTDRKRFPRAQPHPGEDWGAISCFSQSAQQADARAFATVMRHIGQVDGSLHTVLMMQVENEVGLIGSARDHSPEAEALFQRPVPAHLMASLLQNRGSLLPELRQAWEAAGSRTDGTWSAVFGTVADEVFMSWHFGRFIEAVAAAGKAAYPLPMFVNAWLEGEPGSYPSGGPVSRMLDIWRVAAPHIDLLAPDTYGDPGRFQEFCGRYSRSGNPLLIVESNTAPAPVNAFTAFAQYQAIGFGPYPLESPFDTQALGEVYQCLGDMMPLLTRIQGTDRIAGVLLKEDRPQEFDLGDCRIRVTPFTGRAQDGAASENAMSARLPGHGLIIEQASGDYIIVGDGFAVEFLPRPGHASHVEKLTMDEGHFKNGVWIRERRLNGDEWENALKLGEIQPGYSGAKQTLHLRHVILFFQK